MLRREWFEGDKVWWEMMNELTEVAGEVEVKVSEYKKELFRVSPN
jgi:hypothetical protein